MFAAMDQSIEKRSGGDNDGLRSDRTAIAKFDALGKSTTEARRRMSLRRLTLVTHKADLVDRTLRDVAEIFGREEVLDLRHDVRVPPMFAGS